MKKSLILLLFILTSFQGNSQVGINTTTPSETLDVNGTLKVNITNQANVTTTELGGLSADGVFRSINVGPSLKLSNNLLHVSNKHSFGSISPFSDKLNHNVDLLIGPGEANENNTIIRIYNTSGDTEITGIEAGYDGQHIWLYPQDANLTLLDLDVGSLEANQIGTNARLGAIRFGMIELVYDKARSLWIVMQHHN